MKFLRIPLLVLSAIVLSNSAYSGQISWNNNTGGNWSDGTNWLGGSAPGVNDTAIINFAGTYTVTLDVNPSVARIELGDAISQPTISSISRTITLSTGMYIASLAEIDISYTTITGTGTIVNDGLINFNRNNNIQLDLTNNANIDSRHTANTISGNLLTSASSDIHLNASLTNTTLTISNNFINNGLIELSATGIAYTQTLNISGTMTNAAGGTVLTDGPTSGAKTINGEINNQGTMNFKRNTTWGTSGDISINSGTINIDSLYTLTLANTTLDHNAGSINGPGKFYSYYSTVNFNVAVIPDIEVQLHYSTLGSSSPTLTNNGTILFDRNSNITANLNNNGDIFVRHTNNTISGNLTTTTNSVIHINALQSNAVLTITNNFTNNGLIELSASGIAYTQTLNISATMINAPAAQVLVDGPTSGAKTINGEMNNQGTINIKRNTTWGTTGDMSTNTGTINIDSLYTLTISNTTLDHNAGSINGPGKFYSYYSTVNINVAVIPDVEVRLHYSTLGSSSPTLTNNGTILFDRNSNITANLNNNGDIFVRHTNNTISGNLTTTTNSIIHINALQSNAILTISNNFTNNGLIELSATGIAYTQTLNISGTMINAIAAQLLVDGPTSGAKFVNGEIDNQGTINIKRNTTWGTTGDISTNTGTINIDSLYTLTLASKTLDHNSGSINGPGTIYCSYSTLNANVTVIPEVIIRLYFSTLGSSSSPLTNNGTILMDRNSNITADLYNNGVIEIRRTGNTISGALTTSTNSVIDVNGALANHASVTISTGFINFGTIRLSSVVAGYNSTVTLTSGTLINSPGAVLESTGPFTGARTFSGEIDNQGTIDVQYNLTITGAAANSVNTGVINIDTTEVLTILSTTFDYDGGSMSGPGSLFLNNCTFNFNVSAIPAVDVTMTYTTMGSTSNPLINNGNIFMLRNNNITTAIQNQGLIEVRHISNTISGALNTIPGSLIDINAAVSTTSLTVTSGFTNNGTIRMGSAIAYGITLYVTTGPLINAASGLLFIDGPSSGPKTISAEIDNQGTFDIDRPVTLSKTGANHLNTGQIDIASGIRLTINTGSFSFNAGNINGPGDMRFTSSTAIWNTDTIPLIDTWYSVATLASTQAKVTNSGNIYIENSNNVSANLNNNGYIEVRHNSNTMTGRLCTQVGSLIDVTGAQWTSSWTIDSGFVNNGTLRISSVIGYGTTFNVTNDSILNSSTGIIESTGPSAGTRTLGANVYNQGLMDIDYNLTWVHSSGKSTNVNDIEIDTLRRLTFNTGTFCQNAGDVMGPGNMRFTSAIANFNEDTMPSADLWFSTSVLGSSLSKITNSGEIYIENSNNVSANLNNNGYIEVRHNSNTMTGRLCTQVGSLIDVNGAQFTGAWTIDSGFVNNGTLQLSSTIGYSTIFGVTNDSILNSPTGIISSTGPSGGTRTLTAAVYNEGLLDIDYNLNWSHTAGKSTNTALIEIDTLIRLSYSSGTFCQNAGDIVGPGNMLFSGATISFNEDTMPSADLWFSASTLETILDKITNSGNLFLINSNNITADLNNNGNIEVRHTSNTMTGRLCTQIASLINVSGAQFTGSLVVDSGFVNNGTLQISSTIGYHTSFTLSNDSIYNSPTGTIKSTGPSGASRTLTASLYNEGLFSVEYQLNFTTNSFKNAFGGIVQGDQILDINNATLINCGTISPGLSPAKFRVFDNIEFRDSSCIEIEIGGTTVDTQYDQLDLSNLAILGGKLNVTLINGFVPSLADSFIVVEWGTYNDSIFEFTGIDMPNGLTLVPHYRPGYLVLIAGNPSKFEIIATSGANGIISPSDTVPVLETSNKTFDMIPNTGYHVSDVLVDGVSVGALNSYSFLDIDTNHTIHVTFDIDTLHIALTVGANGSVNPDPAFATYGSDLSLNFNPDSCFVVDEVIIDDISQGAITSYTFVNLIEAHSLSVTFKVLNASIAASGATTFCEGNTVNLNAGSGFTSYLWSTGATTEQITASADGNYVVTITNIDGCKSTTSQYVTVHPLPTVNTTVNSPVCLGETLMFTSNGGNSYVWTTPYATYEFTSDFNVGAGYGQAGTYNLSVTDSNTCVKVVQVVALVDTPAIVDAGTEYIFCATLSGQLNGVLNGRASSGTWTTAGSGSFDNASSLNATYTMSPADTAAGFVRLALTSDDPSGPCGVVTDSVTVFYNPPAVATTGYSSDACVDTAIILNGTLTGKNVIPLWSSNGTGSFNNPNALNPTYYSSVADRATDSVTLTMTPFDSSGACVYNGTDLVVWFDPGFTADAGANIQSACDDSTYTLSGLIGGGASSLTWMSNGTGSFDNVNISNATYTFSPADMSAGSVIISLTTDDPVGACPAKTDVVTLYHGATNTSIDNGSATCVDSLILVGSTITGYANQLQWSTNGSGFFDNINADPTFYHPSANDLTADSIQIYLTAIDGNGICTFDAETLDVYFDKQYTVTVDSNFAVCADSIFAVSGVVTGDPVAISWTTSGTGIFSNPDSTFTFYTPSSADTSGGLVILTLSTEDPAGACPAESDAVIVTINSLPFATAGSNTPVCYLTDLNLTASGGVAYEWTGPNGFTSSDQNLIVSNADSSYAGKYIVHVINANGCTDTAITNVTIIDCNCTPPTLLISASDASCYELADADINLTVIAGTPPYSYLWSNGSTNQDLNLVLAGTYTVTVTDAGNCTESTSALAGSPLPLAHTIRKQNVSCNNSANGESTIETSGGTTPYSYIWSTAPLQVGKTATALTGGNYEIYITDANGCQDTANSLIFEPGPLIVIGFPNNADCNGSSTAGVNLAVSGGIAPYTFAWSNGATTEDISNVPSGFYFVLVKDRNGCAKVVVFALSEPAVLNVGTSQTNVTTNGGSDGTASAIPSGGTSPYTYEWNTAPVQTNITATGLVAGNYSVVVTDNNSCTKSAIVLITEPALRLIDLNNMQTGTRIIDVSVYPNPTHGSSTIRFIADGEMKIKIQLFDSRARKLFSSELGALKGLNEKSIELEALPVGIYMLRLSNEKMSKILRVVKN